MSRAAGIVLTERDRRTLSLLLRFRLLNRNQIMALAPFGSLTRANTRLAALVKAGLLSRKLLPIYPGNGSAQALYYLGRTSGTVLDVAPEVLSQQLRQASRWDLRHVEHVLAANQIVVDFLTAVAGERDAKLLDFRVEPELRGMMNDRTLIPDGWFAWAASGKRFNCFVEVDLHNEGLREWRAKVLRYMEYAGSELHDERFGFSSFRVCTLAKSRARLHNLKQIAEVAGRLFLFGQIGAVNATNFFDAIWQRFRGDDAIGLTEAT